MGLVPRRRPACIIHDLPPILQPIVRFGPPPILAPLNVASDETFTRWLALPIDDHRTIEEFAADWGMTINAAEAHRALYAL